MSNQIDRMLAQVPTSGRSSKYMDRLEDGTREVLELFQTWLVEEDGKAASTAAGYKVYVAQAMCHIEDGGNVQELSTDVKSALNALKRFSESDTALLHDAGEDEADDEVQDVPQSGDVE